MARRDAGDGCVGEGREVDWEGNPDGGDPTGQEGGGQRGGGRRPPSGRGVGGRTGPAVPARERESPPGWVTPQLVASPPPPPGCHRPLTPRAAAGGRPEAARWRGAGAAHFGRRGPMAQACQGLGRSLPCRRPTLPPYKIISFIRWFHRRWFSS